MSMEAAVRFGWRELDVQTAAARPGHWRVADVREPDEFTGPLGHIEGAELVPLRGFLQAAATWDKGAPVLLVCKVGGRSAQAASALCHLGFREVMNLHGGMLAWNEAGLPVAR